MSDNIGATFSKTLSDTINHAGPGLIVIDGLIDYQSAHALQHRLHCERVNDERGDALVLLEHPPVITLGRYADSSGVTANEATLARAGVEVRRVERGGQATYHGPGQLVGYTIWKLAKSGIGVKQFVWMIEEVMLRAGERLGAELYRRDGLQGVFCDEGKLGAVGVAVRQGVTLHGFSLNISPNLEHYKWIVPCGITDTPTTSLSTLLGRKIELSQAQAAVLESFGEVFSVKFKREKLPAQNL